MGSIRGSIGSMLVGAEPALLVAEGMLIGWELRTASNVSSRSGFNLLGDVLIMLSSIGSSRPTSGISNSGFLVVVVVVVVEVVVVEAVVVGVVVVEAVVVVVVEVAVAVVVVVVVAVSVVSVISLVSSEKSIQNSLRIQCSTQFIVSISKINF